MPKGIDKGLLKEFKVRVYGILKNDNQYLLSFEKYGEVAFCKFPGGGLELGESTTDCLKREFAEELGVEVEIRELLYTCDFVVQNRFSPSQQVIGIYYSVVLDELALKKVNAELNDLRTQGQLELSHRQWVPQNELESALTFEMDKVAVSKLTHDISSRFTKL